MGRRSEVYDQEHLARMSGGWWRIHGLPLAAPLIGCVVFALVVLGAHAFGGGDPVLTPLLAILLLVIGVGVTWFMVSSAGSRDHFRLVMLATGVIGTMNLVLGLIVGPQVWMVWTYIVSSLIVWAVWAIWRGSKYAGAASSGGPRNQMLEMLEAAPVEFSKPRVDDRGVIRAKWATKPGGVSDDARNLVAPMAAYARAVPGGSNLTTHPDRDGTGEVEIPTRDNLKRSIPWPGLTSDLLGITPVDPFTIGEYQTGPVRVQIVGDVERDPDAHDVGHVKIGGVTGSGKSTGARSFLGSLMAMGRLNIVGVDLSTELQIFGPVAGGLTWLITDEQEARLFMQRIEHVMRGRKAHLAREDLTRWAPRSSLNLLLVWFEESKALSRFTKNYVTFVSDARAAGIWIVSSTQSWIYRALSTDLRKQHPDAICFGMTESDDVGQVLPDSVIEALGKRNLPTWGKSRPGYCYISGIGIPEFRWPKMLRMYNSTGDQLREAVAVGERFRDPMDPVTAELFGELFSRRIRYSLDGRPLRPGELAHQAQRNDHEARHVVEALVGDVDDGDQEEAEAQADAQYAQDRQEMLGRLADARRRNLGDHAEPHDFDDIDPEESIDTEVEDDGEEDGSEPSPTPAEAQRIWDERLDALYRSGTRQVTTAMLTEWLSDVKRERRFLYRQTERWESDGMKCIAPNPAADGWDLIASPLERQPGPPHGV
ncbi:Yip1 family protein [Nonomuraea purpurea]|uniref:Yip1 family protein n=1 Tax=Nonomuraea purpurea TaxID=1849276 RepID=A0ABV8FY89_9ACTN